MDSFKGSLTTNEVGKAVSRGLKRVDPETHIIHIPIADGGEGTLDTILSGKDGKRISLVVEDPLGRPIKASYGILEGEVALIEMASASGLTLLKTHDRDPLLTSTYGTGQLILDALDKGCRKFYVAIGGSATNDGGAGMAEALGCVFKDKMGITLKRGGLALSGLHEIDISNLDSRLKETEFIVLSDVDNPLCGERGASAVYGPQKGASPHMVKELDMALKHFGECIEALLEKEVVNLPGAGAAGGLGAGLIAFCNAQLKSGVEAILDMFDYENKVSDVDLVITGEGQIDFQTLHGKVPVGVARRSKKYQVPVIALVGSIGNGYEAVYESGIDAVYSIVNRPMTLDEAMENADLLLEACAADVYRTFLL